MKIDLTRLRQELEDNPTFTLTALGALLAGVASLGRVGVEAYAANTHRKEVNRRVKISKKK